MRTCSDPKISGRCVMEIADKIYKLSPHNNRLILPQGIHIIKDTPASETSYQPFYLNLYHAIHQSDTRKSTVIIVIVINLQCQKIHRK